MSLVLTTTKRGFYVYYSSHYCWRRPRGASASIALSRQGISNIVIEKHPGTSIHPKARGVNVRAMELCRTWGAEQQIRQSELPVTARRFLWMNYVKGEIQGDVSFITEQEEIVPLNLVCCPKIFLNKNF